MAYKIFFDFDAKGEPPSVYIHDDKGPVLEVLEEPACKLGGRLVEGDWEGPWSWNPDDWEAGPLAYRILEFLSGIEHQKMERYYCHCYNVQAWRRPEDQQR